MTKSMSTRMHTKVKGSSSPKSSSVPVLAGHLVCESHFANKPWLNSIFTDIYRKPSLSNTTLIQPKLTVNQPDDRFEQEADRVADLVMRMPEPSLQRQTDDMEEEEELLQTKPLIQRRVAGDGAGNETGAIVRQVLRSPGRPLDPVTRTDMESRFGHDFSQVRVHTDARATASAQAVDALAYTAGRDVVFL